MRIRKNQADIRATLGGRVLGPFDEAEGFDLSAEDTKINPLGEPEQSLGGEASRADGKIRRYFDPLLDDLHFYDECVGVNTIVVTITWKDRNKNPHGRPRVFSGTLIGAPPVDVSGPNGNEGMMVELTIGSDAEAG